LEWFGKFYPYPLSNKRPKGFWKKRKGGWLVAIVSSPTNIHRTCICFSVTKKLFAIEICHKMYFHLRCKTLKKPIINVFKIKMHVLLCMKVLTRKTQFHQWLYNISVISTEETATSHLKSLTGPSWPWLYGSWILQLPMQLVPMTTNVVSSISRSGRGVQYYVIKFVSDLRPVFLHQ
jgi:hypothetical protein